MKKNRVLSFKYFVYDFIRVTGSPAFLLFRPKRLYEGEKDKNLFNGGLLLASNHISIFDPTYLHLAVPSRRHHSVIAEEFANTKFRRWMFQSAAQCILINRKNVSVASLKEAVNHLKQGDMVTIFPEGRVNDTEEDIQTYKSGVIMMAALAKVKIVPIFIKKREHWYSRLVYVLGKPINVYDFIKGKIPTLDEMKEATKFLENKEKELEEIALKGGKKHE